MNEHTVTVTLTGRERAALDELRVVLGFLNDEAAVLGGLYALAAHVEPNVDPALFRLDRTTALRPEAVPSDAAEPQPGTERFTVEPIEMQPSLWDDDAIHSDGDAPRHSEKC